MIECNLEYENPYLMCSIGLAYCRHLSTVRTHLSALVNPSIVDVDVPRDARGGLTAEVWSTFLQDCSVSTYNSTGKLQLYYIRLHSRSIPIYCGRAYILSQNIL